MVKPNKILRKAAKKYKKIIKMKQKRKVFVNERHEYTISKNDLEFSSRQYKLKTSKALPWAEGYRDKVVLAALDTGNNVTIDFLDDKSPKSITLEYDDMIELYIFLQTYMMDELRPDRIEIKNSKKTQKELLIKMMRSNKDDGNFGL